MGNLDILSNSLDGEDGDGMHMFFMISLIFILKRLLLYSGQCPNQDILSNSVNGEDMAGQLLYFIAS